MDVIFEIDTFSPAGRLCHHRLPTSPWLLGAVWLAGGEGLAVAVDHGLEEEREGRGEGT